MAKTEMSTMEIKTETEPLVPSVKSEPALGVPEFVHFKIETVFNLKTEPTASTVFSPNASNIFSCKSENTSTSENSDDSEQNVPTRSYSLRKRTVQCYDYNENLEETSGGDTDPEPTSHNAPKRKRIDKSTEPKKTPGSKPPRATIETPVIVLTCDICSTAFFDKDSLEEHVIEMHVVDKEFKCSKCSQLFISKETLAEHKLEHKKPAEITTLKSCPICLRPALSEGYFNRHLLTHEALRPFKCKSCEKSYVRNRDLEAHQMSRHGKEKKFKCPKCPKSYARNYVMQDHLRTHFKAKKIVCEYCGCLFKTKQSLRQHWIFCKSAKSEDGSSQANAKKREKWQLAVASTHWKKAVNANYKQHKCGVCNQMYSCTGSLKSHMVIHSDERNFKCNVCKDTFKRKVDLSNHVKSHHERTRAFKCSKCPKSYALKVVLKRHMASHSKSKE